MHKEELYEQKKSEIASAIQFLEDKPEETIDSTLKTLWLASAGIFLPTEDAISHELPVLTDEQLLVLNRLIKKRMDNIPLAHITGVQKFLGVNLKADKRALIPRKETEILGKKALEISKKLTAIQKPVKVIDVCCGSGNLGLAIAKLNPETKVYLTDLSPEAVDLTKENIRYLNLEDQVEARQGDFLEAFETEYFFAKTDLIVCNPPYISTSKVEKMPSEIALNEPSMAFDGGMMGIKIIQKLISESPKYLSDKGWIAFEVGLGQGPIVMQLLERTGRFINIGSAEDKTGNIRAIYAQNKFLDLIE